MADHNGSSDSRFKPISNVCMALNALHIYADEARAGKARSVMAYHYCSHIDGDLRQCLIYDSNSPNARLIGLEYMIPKEKYLSLDPEEQKLWHSHQFEVSSGMLMMPAPPHMEASEWDKQETEEMREIMNLYGKTWHCWQVDRGDELPLGKPVLMGSVTEHGQLDLKEGLKERDGDFGVSFEKKARMRKEAGVDKEGGQVPQNADSWWKEAKPKGRI